MMRIWWVIIPYWVILIHSPVLDYSNKEWWGWIRVLFYPVLSHVRYSIVKGPKRLPRHSEDSHRINCRTQGPQQMAMFTTPAEWVKSLASEQVSPWWRTWEDAGGLNYCVNIGKWGSLIWTWKMSLLYSRLDTWVSLCQVGNVCWKGFDWLH